MVCSVLNVIVTMRLSILSILSVTSILSMMMV